MQRQVRRSREQRQSRRLQQGVALCNVDVQKSNVVVQHGECDSACAIDVAEGRVCAQSGGLAAVSRRILCVARM